MSEGWIGEVRLVEADAGCRLDEEGWADAGLGHGVVRVDRGAVCGRSERAVARRWDGARGVCDARYWHGNVHDPGTACVGKDGRARGQSRSRAWRLGAS